MEISTIYSRKKMRETGEGFERDGAEDCPLWE